MKLRTVVLIAMLMLVLLGLQICSQYSHSSADPNLTLQRFLPNLPVGVRLIDVVLVFFIGVILVSIRSQYRFVYGVFEIVGALVIVYLTASARLEGDWTGFLAGAYLVVRGVDNCDPAFRKRFGRSLVVTDHPE